MVCGNNVFLSLFTLLVMFRADHASEQVKASLAPSMCSNSRTDMVFMCCLACWWEAWDQLRLASAFFPWQRIHPGWAGVSGCLWTRYLWGGHLGLLGSTLAAWCSWAETAFLLCARESEATWALACVGLAGLHLLSQCNNFILEVCLYSQYHENGVLEWVFVDENQSCHRECCPSFLESVCLHSGPCPPDIPGYPEYEQVLDPVVILGLDSTEHFIKKNVIFFQTWEGGLSGRRVYDCMFLSVPCAVVCPEHAGRQAGRRARTRTAHHSGWF